MNKDICKKCSYNGPVKITKEQLAHDFLLNTNEYMFFNFDHEKGEGVILRCDGNRVVYPPDWCPYILEHIVSA